MNVAVKTMELIDVYNHWLDMCDSEATRRKYESVPRDFFRMMFEKEIEDIDKIDILSISPMSVNRKYLQVMKDRGIKNTTIINRLSVLNSLFKKMAAYQLYDNEVNYTLLFDEVFSSKKIKSDSVKTASLTHENYLKIMDWLENVRFADSPRHKVKGKQYALLLDTMWHTAIRISAIFNLKWSDIKYEADDFGVMGYVAYPKDKGSKTNYKPLSDELYLELYDTFYSGNEEEPIFSEISQTGFTCLLSEYSESFNIKVTPHSIKRGAVSYLYAITKDPVVTQRFADHEKFDTTLRYIENNKSRTEHGSYYLDDSNVDLEALSKLNFKDVCDILKNDRKDILVAIYYKALEKGLICESIT
ncbi:site-specific integrase [Aerococcaceae bacterium zg-B36]|uniref:tyrosine-type recombinase/integrase n=1 Tax=Aerococcaceae bacterium zg-252 TaxID=2796928 RepID=UPI001BD85639|nr:site-specific integrase [Aerococcaceae bacterium zg-B36]